MKFIHPTLDYVSAAERTAQNGHRSAVLWFTGLSGSGKSTIAKQVERKLFETGKQVKVLDGDNIRSGLNSNLGFSTADRTENIRRIAHVAKLFADAGFIVITAFISPTSELRQQAGDIIGKDFHEIYINSSLQTCEQRDVKGLYAKARAGEIPDFTGISAPWEVPTAPTYTVDTEHQDLETATGHFLQFIHKTIAL